MGNIKPREDKLNENDDDPDTIDGGGGFTGVGPNGAPYTGYAPPPQPPNVPISEPGVTTDPVLTSVMGGLIDGAAGVAIEIGMAIGEKLAEGHGGGGKGK